jgi:hypothetical protein
MKTWTATDVKDCFAEILRVFAIKEADMETKNPLLDEFLETVDELSPEELEKVEKRLASARDKKNGNAPISSSPQAVRDLFAISFADYLAMSREERNELQIAAYRKYAKWIEQELGRHDARWILVCGGKVVESGPTLRNYPRAQNVRMVGERYGLMPFVFVRGPVIEELKWSALPHDDSYPNLPIFIAAEGSNPSKLKSNGLAMVADLDTGSTDILLDYEQLLEKGIIENQDTELHEHSHLNSTFHYYSLPVLLGVITERGRMISGIIETMCVEDWSRSPLRFTNPFRQALAGRNLLMELPLRLELNGRKRITKILG